MSASSADLVEHTARFCRRLRAEGLSLGPGDTLDATRALGSVDLMDREDVRLGLRTALVKRVEVARNEVNVVFRIDPYPSDNDPEKKSLQLCRGREHRPLWHPG